MKYVLVFILFALPLFCFSQRTDTIQVSCSFTNIDTSYQNIRVCDTTYTKVFYDSVYYVKRFFWIVKKVKETDSTRTDINCRYVSQMIINTYTYDSWCDSIIFTPAKKPITGLMVRQEDWIDTSDLNIDFLKNVSGLVIRINWSDLQPTPGLLNTSYIDRYISLAERIERLYGFKMAFKLRVITGVFSPQWVKDEVGSFKLTKGEWANDPNNVCPRWWDSQFAVLWANLQTQLAAYYDNNEYIREVVMSATSAKTGEAMIRAVNENGKDEYLNAGYTSAKDLSSIYDCTEAMKVWKLTNIGMSITPFAVINPTQRVYEEIATTKNILTYFANKFGRRATVGNNGLRTPDGHNGDNWAVGGAMYNLCLAYIQASKDYGANIFFQTASVDRQDSELTATLNQGLYFRAKCIELPQTQKKILETLSLIELKHYKDLLENN